MAQTPVEELIDAIQAVVRAHRAWRRERNKNTAEAIGHAVDVLVEVYEKHPAQAIANELFARHGMPRRDN
jgi:flagellar motility protein MotE (MotC chaperone)